jgi:hypothetical protein
VSDDELSFLSLQVERCRRWAKIADERSAKALLKVAEEYEARIVAIEKRRAADRLLSGGQEGA